MQTLAQELIDQIIDALHISDAGSMKTCGLVCTSWMPRSRHHLFSSVSISRANLLPFVELIHASSLLILSFVRDLHLDYDGDPQWLWDLNWIHQCPNLGAFGLRLHCKVVDLEPIHPHIRAWADSGSISELSLIGEGIRLELAAVLDILADLPLVTSLHLEGSWSETTSPLPCPPNLHTLALFHDPDGGENFLSWLLSFPVVPRLRSFKCSGPVPYRHHESSMVWYLQRTGGDLQSLSLLFRERWGMELERDPFDALDLYRLVLPHTTSLRHFSFRFRDPASMCETLALLSAPTLESITIARLPNLYSPDNKVPWSVLDKALADPRFQNLRHLSVVTISKDGVETSLITSQTQGLMPLATARGLLGPRLQDRHIHIHA
ncbi:hypothetical protein MVEN_00442700 [Mycena venus]|uniref:Uncharacterized protein n=1 Tax=Mycena venus TaxID=2733690 RepID=A0A8H6YXK8_9AGAR|nr:hypothetical protein MVEN_00442700 [Mycena venus]